MKYVVSGFSRTVILGVVLLVGSGLSRTTTQAVHAQIELKTVDQHVKAAEKAAGQDYRSLFVSAADWDLLDKSAEPKPKRDMVITDGMKLTLGDTTLTIYLTPGHTQGTVSTIIPVRDNGKPHVAAVWGGTLFNWLRNRNAYITPSTPDSYWFENYIASARKFREIAANAGADILLSNHTAFDGSKTRLPAVRARKPGEPHPYVVGNASVGRFLIMAEECAKAGLLRTRQ